jgi:antitoxin component HigA of HigAB toxin-antitoxin module
MLVGDRWQRLDRYVKNRYEVKAAQKKERYYVQLSDYKKTESYAAYQEYLTDFRAKQDNKAEQSTDPSSLSREILKAASTGVHLREVFDGGYSVHRQEEEAKRRARVSRRMYPAMGKLNEERDDFASDFNSLSAEVDRLDQTSRDVEDDNPVTRGKNRAAQRAFRERRQKHLEDLKSKLEDLDQAFQSPFGERNTENEKHLKALKKEVEAYEKRYQHAQPESIIPHYTISRDFSGCNNDVATSILSYLGERENKRGDLSVLVRR